MKNLELIRLEEKKYHDSCYENYKLFEEGSWLHKPVKTVMDSLELLIDKENIQVLDLGAGVGRNTIPIAQKIKHLNGKVICVDILESAIEKLDDYSKKYDVGEIIETEQKDIGHYNIEENTFDFIVAVSTLEHIENEEAFHNVVQQMKFGTKRDGINCLIVNSEVEETDTITGEALDVMMEVNLKTKDMILMLENIYKGWEVISQVVKPLEYRILRNERDITLKTNAITFVVRNVVG